LRPEGQLTPGPVDGRRTGPDGRRDADVRLLAVWRKGEAEIEIRDEVDAGVFEDSDREDVELVIVVVRAAHERSSVKTLTDFERTLEHR